MFGKSFVSQEPILLQCGDDHENVSRHSEDGNIEVDDRKNELNDWIKYQVLLKWAFGLIRHGQRSSEMILQPLGC